MDTCATTTTKTKLPKLRTEPKSTETCLLGDEVAATAWKTQRCVRATSCQANRKLLPWRRNEQCFQRFHHARLSQVKSAKSASISSSTSDDHYPVCRLDIRQDREFATGYGYPKTAFKREPDTDPDIRNAFRDISRIQIFGKSCTLHNHSFIIFRSIFTVFCAMTPSLSVV